MSGVSRLSFATKVPDTYPCDLHPATTISGALHSPSHHHYLHLLVITIAILLLPFPWLSFAISELAVITAYHYCHTIYCFCYHLCCQLTWSLN